MAPSRSSDHRKAASVLPEPVGATTSACSPLLIADQAPSWAAVGCSNAPVNHAWVGAENRTRAESGADTPSSVHGGTTVRPARTGDRSTRRPVASSPSTNHTGVIHLPVGG